MNVVYCINSYMSMCKVDFIQMPGLCSGIQAQTKLGKQSCMPMLSKLMWTHQETKATFSEQHLTSDPYLIQVPRINFYPCSLKDPISSGQVICTTLQCHEPAKT